MLCQRKGKMHDRISCLFVIWNFIVIIKIYDGGVFACFEIRGRDVILRWLWCSKLITNLFQKLKRTRFRKTRKKRMQVDSINSVSNIHERKLKVPRKSLIG